MEKNDIQRLLEQKGTIGAAAKAAGVDYPRYRQWVNNPDKVTDDGHLRAWLALHRPEVLALYWASRAMAAARVA